MGSDSDLEIMNEAAKALDDFGIAYEIDVTSAHRSPARTSEYARNAAGRMDSLLAIVQMPAGIPVATTAIGKPGATNAGILAAQIIGLSNTTVAGKLKEMKGKLVKSVEEKSQKLQQLRKR
jgi:phosphoribosylcarboxyaminoimidazole (NCAIR) mutase